MSTPDGMLVRLKVGGPHGEAGQEVFLGYSTGKRLVEADQAARVDSDKPTADQLNHAHTAKLNSDKAARKAAIVAAVQAQHDANGVIVMRMQHGGTVRIGSVQACVIALERRDAVALVNADGSLQEF